MASTIRIKRSGTSGNPTVLGQGELAYSYLPDNGANGGDRLYIGTGTEIAGNAVNHEIIGGKYFTDMLDHPRGSLQVNSALITNDSAKLNELKVDNLIFDNSTISTFAGNLTLISTTGTISASGGVISDVSTPIQDSDVANKLYVDNAISGNGFFISSGAADSDFFISSTSATLVFEGGTGINTTVTDDRVTHTLADTTVSPGSYGGQTAIPSFTVDAQGRLTAASEVSVATNLTLNGDSISLLDSDITLAGSDNVSLAVDSANNTLTFSVADASTTVKGVSTFNPEDFTVNGGASVSLGNDVVKLLSTDTGPLTPVDHTVSIGGSNNIDVTHTGNSISVALTNDITSLTGISVGSLRLENNVLRSSGFVGDSSTQIIIDPNPTDSAGGEVVILGDLTVQGTTTTINSTEVSVDDLTFTLAGNAADPTAANGAGIIIGGANATLTYSLAGDQWNSNKNFAAPDFIVNGTPLNEHIQDFLGTGFITAGEGIDITYDDPANTLTIDAELATVTNPGVASFDSDQFTVTSGAVTVTELDGGIY